MDGGEGALDGEVGEVGEVGVFLLGVEEPERDGSLPLVGSFALYWEATLGKVLR